MYNSKLDSTIASVIFFSNSNYNAIVFKLRNSNRISFECNTLLLHANSWERGIMCQLCASTNSSYTTFFSHRLDVMISLHIILLVISAARKHDLSITKACIFSLQNTPDFDFFISFCPTEVYIMQYYIHSFLILSFQQFEISWYVIYAVVNNTTTWSCSSYIITHDFVCVFFLLLMLLPLINWEPIWLQPCRNRRGRSKNWIERR